MAHSPGRSSTSQVSGGSEQPAAPDFRSRRTPLMRDPGPLFEEPWPDAETRLVVDSVRSAVTAPGGATQNRLAEAGRRWARAHQSASLMRARLGDLEASMEAELRTASEADRMAYYRAWRTVTDAATWTSLTQLEEAALLDPLTGVGNRRALDLMLSRATSVAQRAGSELAVVAVDLDGLKRINDSQGHAEGDRTLTSLVDAFGERLRGSDTVFRTGGDEFAVVLPGMRLGDVEGLMHRISAGGAPGFTWGAAAFDIEHQRPADLLDAADTDLYRRRGVEREAVGAGTGEGSDGGAECGCRLGCGGHHPGPPPPQRVEPDPGPAPDQPGGGRRPGGHRRNPRGGDPLVAGQPRGTPPEALRLAIGTGGWRRRDPARCRLAGTDPDGESGHSYDSGCQRREHRQRPAGRRVHTRPGCRHDRYGPGQSGRWPGGRGDPADHRPRHLQATDHGSGVDGSVPRQTDQGSPSAGRGRAGGTRTDRRGCRSSRGGCGSGGDRPRRPGFRSSRRGCGSG